MYCIILLVQLLFIFSCVIKDVIRNVIVNELLNVRTFFRQHKPRKDRVLVGKKISSHCKQELTDVNMKRISIRTLK